MRRYELRAGCGPARVTPQRHASATPDAALFFADRLLAVDHATGDAYALALVPHAAASEDADVTAWLDAIQKQVAALAPRVAAPVVPATPAAVWEGSASTAPPASFALRRGREEYKCDVATALEAIRAGETYEACLTTALERAQGAVAPRALYTALRTCNPAPYAAWLRFGGGGGADADAADADALAVCCSSPERFLRLDRQARHMLGGARCTATMCRNVQT
jgi:para-aminobenzoate synthetase